MTSTASKESAQSQQNSMKIKMVRHTLSKKFYKFYFSVPFFFAFEKLTRVEKISSLSHSQSDKRKISAIFRWQSFSFNAQVFSILFRIFMERGKDLWRAKSYTSTMESCSCPELEKTASGQSRNRVRLEPDELQGVPHFVFLWEQKNSFARNTWTLPGTRRNQQSFLFCIPSLSLFCTCDYEAQRRDECSSLPCSSMSTSTAINRRGVESATNNDRCVWPDAWTILQPQLYLHSTLDLLSVRRSPLPHAFWESAPTRVQLLLMTRSLQP